MVHHDIWDYDAPSPTVLFDAKKGSRTIHGIGEAEKTGWLYLLDRRTGKPLLPIPERPVPQDRRQRTARTQPIPSYPSYVPRTPSRSQVAQVRKAAAAAAKSKRPPRVRAAKHDFEPFWHDMVVITPGPQGGTNWQPSSYNPDTNMFYVCGQSGPSGYTAETEKPAKQKKGGTAQTTLGSTLSLPGFGPNPGVFAAIDATTGRIMWRKRWPESCYASSTTTAGNLVFTGRSTGDIIAFDARSGRQLWSFQTGAGANNGPTVFRHDGKEYLAFYAGGNALAASPHGDNLWLFGLDGKLGPVPAPGSGKGVEHAGAAPEQNAATGAGDPAAGKQVFAGNCSTCHGLAGTGGNGGPNLKSIPAAKNLQKVIAQVTNGGGGMPPFKGTLTQKQIRDVAAYVTKLTGGR
jgi:alcohol dehydrogenase (cytochrome c)